MLFPLHQVYFEVSYKEDKNSAYKTSSLPSVSFSPAFLKKYIPLYKNIIKKSLKIIDRPNCPGEFHLDCTIPFSSGLGSSAGFCLSLSKIFFKLGWIRQKQILDLALQLEHEFHEKSSGADLQVIYHKKPVLFKNFKSATPIHLKWKPHFYLYNTSLLSPTKMCVKKVNTWTKNHPDQAVKTDQQMRKSVKLCLKAFEHDRSTGLKLLVQAMNQAGQCFEQWGLFSPQMLKKANELKKQGALAVKPTGAGGGGFLVGLWNHPLGSPKKNSLYLSP